MARIEKYLIDTNILITHLRKPELVDAGLFKIIKENSGCISILTTAELFSGKSTTDKSIVRDIHSLLNYFKAIPIDQNIATKGGMIRRDHNITLIDALIASTAIEYNLALVTLNYKDFDKISNLELFKI